jgi:molybdopterin converting factor small subunit
MNAVKWGIFSKRVVVHGLQIRERSKEFEELRERLWEELAPVGAVEEMLVDRVVTAHWRLRRALTAEAGEIALSVDGGHWERKKSEPEEFRAFFRGFHDTLTEMEQSARGLSYLIRTLEELRERVTGEGEVTEAALGQFRCRFGEMGNALTRELEGLRTELAANPGGLSVEALKKEIQVAILGRVEGRLNLYRYLSGECEEREEKEEEARQAAEVLPSPGVLDKILKYEGKLERQLYRAMNQLERLQRRRNGEVVPPPITVDVS